MLPEWVLWGSIGVFLVIVTAITIVECVLMWDLCKPIKKDDYE